MFSTLIYVIVLPIKKFVVASYIYMLLYGRRIAYMTFLVILLVITLKLIFIMDTIRMTNYYESGKVAGRGEYQNELVKLGYAEYYVANSTNGLTKWRMKYKPVKDIDIWDVPNETPMMSISE